MEHPNGRGILPQRTDTGAGISMSDRNQTYAMLRGIQMFSDFSDEECNRLLEVMRPLDVASGESVFQQGGQGDTLVVVMDGILRVEVADQAGNSATVATIQSGEVVGEMAVLDPAPRSASVIAATDCRVLELSRDGLKKLRSTCPSASAAIVGAVIADVTRRLRNVNKRIDKELDPEHRSKKKQYKTTLDSRIKKDDEQGFLSKLLSRFGR